MATISTRPPEAIGQPLSSLISTPRGMVRLDDLSPDSGPVYDSTGLTSVTRVTTGRRRSVRRLRLINGSFIDAAPSHLIRVAGTADEGLIWRRVDAVERGARLLLHAHRSRVSTPAEIPGRPRTGPACDWRVAGGLGTASDPAAVAAAAVAGWLQADGCIGRWGDRAERSLTMELHASGADEWRWVSSQAAVALPGAHQDPGVNGPRGTDVRISGPALMSFANSWPVAVPAACMCVPHRLWTAHADEVVAYLRSLFQVRGQVTIWAARGVDASITLTLTGEPWVEGVQILLGSLGIYSSRVPAPRARNRRPPRHALRIDVGSERARFADLIGFVARGKQRLLLDSLGLGTSSQSPHLRLEEVEAISDRGVQPVAGLETASGSYLSNNIEVWGGDGRSTYAPPSPAKGCAASPRSRGALVSHT